MISRFLFINTKFFATLDASTKANVTLGTKALTFECHRSDPAIGTEIIGKYKDDRFSKLLGVGVGGDSGL